MDKKRTMKNLTLFIFIIQILLLVACEDRSADHNEDLSLEQETTIETASDTSEVKTVYMLPSPLRIANLFKNSGMHYIGGLTNSNGNISNYNTKHDLTLNFGIYSADMAYCMINNQSQQVINYMTSLKKLSEKLWLTDVLSNTGVYERIERNINNPDSLIEVVTFIQMEVDNYLEENGMNQAGSVIFAGAWVETIHIAFKVIENEPNNNLLIAKLSEQSTVLNSLIKSIKQLDVEEEYDYLVVDLEEINAYFHNLTGEDNEAIDFRNEDLTELGNKITALRTKIING